MSAQRKTLVWTMAGALLGAVAGAYIGIALEQRGLGPTGVGIAIGAAIGYLIGLPREE